MAQLFLIIIEHVYMSMQGDQNATLPAVIPNYIYRSATVLQNLVIVTFLPQNLLSGIPSGDPCTIS